MSAFATPSRHYPAKVHHVVASVLTDIAISFLARRPLLCHPQHAVSAQSLNYIHFYVSAVICTCSQDCHALNHSIIPPQLSLYMSLAPEQKLTYPLAGPAGPAAFNAGMAGFEAQSFRGLGVFTSTPYEVSDGECSIKTNSVNIMVSSMFSLLTILACSCLQTRTASRCSSARRRSASSTAWPRLRSGTRPSPSFRRRTWVSNALYGTHSLRIHKINDRI